MDCTDIAHAGVFVELAFTHEQIEQAISAETAQGIVAGECAFLVDLRPFNAADSTTIAL